MKNLTPIDLGIAGDGVVYRNLSVPELTMAALERG